jgi:hypothetical protein
MIVNPSDLGDFAAITSYFNPCGYRNREIGYQRFADGLRRQGVSLWTIEATRPGASRFVPPGPQVVHIELPENDWLWQKERLLNLLVKRLPPAIQKVAWIDCDLVFDHEDWPRMACDALDTWPVIQLFDFVYWLGPNDEKLSFEGITDRRASVASIAMHYPDRAQDFRIGTPGFAWAAHRSLLDSPGLYENEITGGNDSVFVTALYGWPDHGVLTMGTQAMIRDTESYIEKVYQSVRGYVGYIPCSIRHLWHGNYQDRAYTDRRLQLKRLGFDPFRDLEDDPKTGLLRWSKLASPELRSYLQSYFHSRKEDAQPIT